MWQYIILLLILIIIFYGCFYLTKYFLPKRENFWDPSIVSNYRAISLNFPRRNKEVTTLFNKRVQLWENPDDPSLLLQLDHCFGISWEEFIEDKRFDHAPCLIKHFISGGWDALKNDIVNTVASLGRVCGPIYAFIGNHGGIECYLVFPSMMKDGKPFLNYEFIGRSHRWLYTLLRRPQYTADISKCAFGCNNAPYWEERNWSWSSFSFYSIYHVVPCGNIPDSPPATRRHRKSPEKPFVMDIYFAIYEVKLSHSSIAPYIIDGPNDILLNVLPQSIKLLPGCINQLVSPNRHWVLQLIENAGLILQYMDGNGEECGGGQTVWFISANQPGASLSLGSNGRAVLVNNGADVWAIESVEGGKAPYALVLDNNGTLTVYDSTNMRMGYMQRGGKTNYNEPPTVTTRVQLTTKEIYKSLKEKDTEDTNNTIKEQNIQSDKEAQIRDAQIREGQMREGQLICGLTPDGVV